MDKSASDTSPRSFEFERGGVRHRYELRAEGLHYSAGAKTPTVVDIAWSELTGFKPAAGGTVFLQRKRGQPLAVWLAPKDLSDFMGALLLEWGRHDRERALKIGFDFGSSEPAVGWIWLVLSLVFPGLLALLLLSDGYHERHCTRLLEAGELAAAKVLMIKKNRRGNFVWRLEFRTPSGATINGFRESPLTAPGGEPIGSKDDVTVIYSDQDSKCWDLSLKPHERALNEGQRSFTVFLDLTFGWIFAVVALIGAFFSVRRIRTRYPFREALRAATEKLKTMPPAPR